MSEPVRGINFERLTPWFREHVAPVGEITAKVIGHGRSNITYLIESEGKEWVLRRPPLSHVLPTAHDMKREFRVISALEHTDVPVPHAIALCEDTAVNDAPFYIMSFVAGIVPADPAVVKQKYTEDQRRRMGDELIDVLVRFHAVDPAKVGLADFGKPQGFIARQVKRFIGQIEQSKQRDLPELEELGRRLSASIPEESAHTLVHGDYRLDNCVISEDGHIAAVLDWEMATLGDPLTDLGAQVMYWPERSEGTAAAPPGSGIGSQGVLSLPGFPTRSDAMARYAEKSGRDLSNIDFYAVLAFFKLAVILEGIHARFLEGGTVGPGFETMANQVLVLARQGLAIADNSSVASLRG